MKHANIIYVLSDEHRGHAMGHARDPNVRTPGRGTYGLVVHGLVNMDKLSIEGRRVENRKRNDKFHAVRMIGDGFDVPSVVSDDFLSDRKA